MHTATSVTTEAAGRDLFFDRLYAQADSIEQRCWKQHKELLRAVPHRETGFRGGIGLGLMLHTKAIDNLVTATVERKDRVFVQDKYVRWVSMVDVPMGYFRGQLNRPVRWATLRPTCQRYGVPRLTPGTERLQVDFAEFPFDPVRITTVAGVQDMFPAADALQPRGNNSAFRMFNAINEAMTSTAFRFRRSWQVGRAAANKYYGAERSNPDHILSYGSHKYSAAAPPEMWMPKPYIGFPAHLQDDVFDRVTRLNHTPEMASTHPVGLQEEFCKDLEDRLTYYARFDGYVASVRRQQHAETTVLVLELVGTRGEVAHIRYPHESAVVLKAQGTVFNQGDAIACEQMRGALPYNWRGMTQEEKWNSRVLTGRFTESLRLWFERKAVTLANGFVHFPAKIASVAALSSAVTECMFWDITDSMQYYNEHCESLVFPPLHIFNWYDLEGTLPGDIAYDFSPNDVRFESYHAQVARVTARRKPR